MEIQTSVTKVLVVRNDKLGDFMLIYPALALLKQSAPHIHISVLVPGYTADMAKICPWIDDIILTRIPRQEIKATVEKLHSLQRTGPVIIFQRVVV